MRDSVPRPATPSDGAVQPLPPPHPLLGSLHDAIASRASCRSFTVAPLTLPDVSAVLQAGYGQHGWVELDGFEFESRPVPSAGARYPLEIHLIAHSVAGLEIGTYRYLPALHSLQRTGPAVDAQRVCEIFLDQGYLAAASAIAVLVARLEPSLSRYGDRGYRYVLFEAGHVAQNINLAGNACGLGTVDLGGFLDLPLAEALGLSDQIPLYGVALGSPSSA
ncbi:MAG: SagB/ThcOx family dehydrogenase [Acidimicrobiales bacterium]